MEYAVVSNIIIFDIVNTLNRIMIKYFNMEKLSFQFQIEQYIKYNVHNAIVSINNYSSRIFFKIISNHIEISTPSNPL